MDSLGGTRGAPGSGLLRASLCYGQPAVGPPQDLPRTGPFAIEVVLKFRQNPAPVQNRDSGQLDSLRGTREAPGRQERSIWTACEAPGRHQGGRKEAPGKHQGGRKGPTAEAAGRQKRTNWTAWEAPGGHQGGRK